MLIVKVELESESTCGGYSQWKGIVVLPLLPLLFHFVRKVAVFTSRTMNKVLFVVVAIQQ